MHLLSAETFAFADTHIRPNFLHNTNLNLSIHIHMCVGMACGAYLTLNRFHNLLITDEFGCLPAVKDAIMPLPTFEDEMSPDRDAIMAEALCSYFDSIIKIPEVRNSLLLSGFLDEWSFQGWMLNKNLGNGCDESETNLTVPSAPITAIDFLLQPFEPQKLFIRRCTDYNRDIIILKV